jgi:cytochrome c biogenesis protein CcmG, thiol:disulfide interchange protein DsbE
MTTRLRAAVSLACLALAGVIVVGVLNLPGGSSGGGDTATLTPKQASTLLASSPPPLAELHRQAGVLLNGGTRGFRARLAALKAYPVVINKWASWCEPCKEEFGVFQNVSARFGRRVAFLGIDSGDSRSEALKFLHSHPLTYPSYSDATGELGQAISYSSFTPVTVFIARDGRQFIWQGQFPTVAKLTEDVERYALDA